MDDVPEALRDAGYVLVGLAVIGFQRAQVARHELARQLPGMAEHLPPAAREAVEAVKAALRAEPPRRPPS